MSNFVDSVDICLRPPIILKNCLPVPLVISYEDSNGNKDTIDLSKEEEKHIFVFNLKRDINFNITV